MISVHFQGKPFNINQVYAPTTEVKETETDWLYEGLPEKAMAPHSSTLALKMNNSEIEPKSCILDCFVDYEGYSISSKEFLPTVVDTMVI